MENKQVNDIKTLDIRFSVLIPTRERDDTLKYAIQTCLDQQFDSYEIIIQDNCSSSATKEVVDSFKSEKIKYFRSNVPLAMSENWELALSHAVGEYIIFIGDDDGLLLNSLPKIDRLIRELNVKAICWIPVNYIWPNVPLPSANMIKIPWKHRIRFLQSMEVIPKAANNQLNPGHLPMIYHNAIHRDLIALLRKKTGRVFGACAPDVYTGFAFAYLLEVYPVLDYPMSIVGVSAKSNGLEQSLLQDKKSNIVQEFDTLNAKSGLGWHPKTPNVPIPIFLSNPDAFQRAKDALFPNDTNFYINRKNMIMGCIAVLKPTNEEKWKEYIKAIHESLSDDIGLQKWFDSKFSNYSPCLYSKNNLQLIFDSKFLRQYFFSHTRKKLIKLGKNFRGDYILDAREFSVKDVFGVAELYDKTKGFKLSRLSPKYAYLRLGNMLFTIGCSILRRFRG
ncbi:putative glycosyl transferase [groundwater metagenome]|uniref:Putative glycosyl transferase n=1 Tax=groundwater metagenome TaxID=717931 RepID=A0A098E9A0_9ZZZZ